MSYVRALVTTSTVVGTVGLVVSSSKDCDSDVRVGVEPQGPNDVQKCFDDTENMKNMTLLPFPVQISTLPGLPKH